MVQLTIETANKALQRILIWKLLFDLGFVLQPLVAALNQIRGVDAFSDCLGEEIETEQARLSTLENSTELRIFPIVLGKKCLQRRSSGAGGISF